MLCTTSASGGTASSRKAAQFSTSLASGETLRGRSERYRSVWLAHAPVDNEGSGLWYIFSTAQAPMSENAKVALVYQHELPNCPGKSIKGELVKYVPGGFSPGYRHPKSAFIYATVLERAVRSQVNDGPVSS